MQNPKILRAVEELGRVRLACSFFMRDFLYSEISNAHGIANLPGDPDLARDHGLRRGLCERHLFRARRYGRRFQNTASHRKCRQRTVSAATRGGSTPWPACSR
jgi:hypothetical protein